MEEDAFDVFFEAQLPVTKSDITKPTKDFVVNLITVFFNTFHIDGFSIKQATQDQLSVLISKDYDLYEEVIKLINMQVSMSGIYDRIFVKDFQLVDITSPSPKKTVKLIKFLANFILYYRNKLSDIEERVNEIANRRDVIEQSIHNTKDAREKIAISKTYRESQLDYNENLKQKIEEVRKRTNKKSEVTEKKKEQTKLLEQERQKVIKIHASKKSEALKVNEKTADIQAQVVESPQQLRVQLQELEKQRDLNIQERELKYESIKEKKKLLERRENIQAFIQKQAEILVQVLKMHEEKKEMAKKVENIIKEQVKIQDLISGLEKNKEIQQNHCSASEITELNQQVEQRLLPLRGELTQLSKERKELDVQIKEEQERYREALLQMDGVNEETMILEKETSDFLKQCQELYNQEISENAEISQLLEDSCKE